MSKDLFIDETQGYPTKDVVNRLTGRANILECASRVLVELAISNPMNRDILLANLPGPDGREINERTLLGMAELVREQANRELRIAGLIQDPSI